MATKARKTKALAPSGGVLLDDIAEGHGSRQLERLINVAARLFYEHGYDATSLQEVADELGLLKGSLYHYINSKDDLLYATIIRQHRTSLALVESCRQESLSPRKSLEKLVHGYAQSLEKDHIFVSVYLRDFNRLSRQRRTTIIRERLTYVQYVVDLLTEGQAVGEFRPDLDPALTAQGILGMLNSSYRWYKPGASPTAAQIIDEFSRLIFCGVSTAEPVRPARMKQV